MKKYILAITLFLGLTLACEQNEPEPIISFITINGDEVIVNDYISNSDLKLYSQFVISDDYLFAYGLKDSKVYIKGFDIYTKQNIWTYTISSDLQIGKKYTIDKGYGDIITYTIDQFGIDNIVKLKNGYVLLITYYSKDDGYHIQNLLTISGSVQTVKELTTTGQFYRIFKWFEDTFLLLNPNPETLLQCYSFPQNLIFENLAFTTNEYTLSRIFPINVEEGILYVNKFFICNNLKSNKVVWKSLTLENIPDNARIDKTRFEVIDKDFTKFTINYTLYEGDKKELNVKINNETGELQIL